MSENLSPRMKQVTILVGRERLSYKAIAKRLDISPRTVHHYAESARDRINPDLSPRDALTVHYWQVLSNGNGHP